MIKQTNDELTKPILKFFITSLVTLIVALLVSTFYLSNQFLEKEQVRSKIVSEQISQSLNTEYRYIVEEFFTTRFESIFIRVKNKLSQLDSKTFKIYLTNSSDQCVYSKNSLNLEIPCNTGHIDLFRNDLKSSIVHHKHKLVYHSSLLLSTEEIGHIYIELDDKYKFFSGSATTFIKDNFLPLIAIVIVFWLISFVYSWKSIISPFISNLLKAEKQKTSSETLAQIIHDTKYEFESILYISEELGKSLDNESKKKSIELRGIIENIQEAYSGLAQSDGEIVDLSEVKHLNVFNLLEKSKERLLLKYNHKKLINITFENCSNLKNTFVLVQENLFLRVISNFVSNSIESTNANDSINISISTSLTNKQLNFLITDNGSGVPDNIKDDIFVLGSTTKDTGTGKGLPFIKKTVESWNGSVGLKSSSPKGSCFFFYLPFKCRKFIVLEDDKKSIQRYRNYFEETNKSYVLYSDPQLLLEKINEVEVFDIAILDYDLGSTIKGTDVAKKLYEFGLNNIFIRSGSFVEKKDHPYLTAIIDRLSTEKDINTIESLVT